MKMNQTELDAFSELSNVTIDPFQEAYTEVYSRIYFALAFFLVEVPGNYLLVVLIVSIHQDPLVMLTDRLLSVICFLAILVNCLLGFAGEDNIERVVYGHIP